MPVRQKFYVLQSYSGVEVAGSEHNDRALQDEADRIGGTIIDPAGNIVYDATSAEAAKAAESADRSASRAVSPIAAALQAKEAVDHNRA